MAAARAIAHFDLDCFFVAVERLKNPGLIGKPVIVGGNPESRAVVASASYEARRHGVHSAMPIRTALKTCPEAVLVPGDFKSYDSCHRHVREIASRFSPNVQMASIDEGYIDLSGTERVFGSSYEAGIRIHEAIKSESGLDCSVGVASNRLVAKIAANYVKPNGVIWIIPGLERDFLTPLAVGDIPGVGPSSETRLRQMGISTIGALAKEDKEHLKRRFGLQGHYLYGAARGRGGSEGIAESDRKSIGKETTFAQDTDDMEFLLANLHYLVQKVGLSLRKKGLRSMTISVKYRYDDFETHSCAQSLPYPVQDDSILYEIASSLLQNHVRPGKRLRLLGTTVSNFKSELGQIDLFEGRKSAFVKTGARTTAIDKLRERHGFESILTGEDLRLLQRKERF